MEGKHETRVRGKKDILTKDSVRVSLLPGGSRTTSTPAATTVLGYYTLVI